MASIHGRSITLWEAVAGKLGEELKTDVHVRIVALPKAGHMALEADYSGTGFEFRFSIDNRDVSLLAQPFRSTALPQLEDAARQVDALAENRGAIPVLLLTRSSAALRSRLRERGINYIDADGNFLIRDSGLYLSHEAAPMRRGAQRIRAVARDATQAPSQHVNPFSKRASLVLRYLFEAPGGRHRGRHPVTEISGKTGISHVWVLRVLDALERSHYVSREAGGEVKLVDVPAVLRAWRLAYDWTRNERTSWVVPYESDELRHVLPRALTGLKWAYSALAGSDLVAPVVWHPQTHCYVEAKRIPEALERISERIHARPSGEGGTLHIMKPYYGSATFFGARMVKNVYVVSDLQLFLDLAAFPLRGAEAATALVRNRMAKQLELTATEVQEIEADLT